MNWAIVIGIDEYGSDDLRLSGAVADAETFCAWAVRESGGNVPPGNVRVLLGRSPQNPEDRAPTKDNIVTAIQEVVTAGREGGEQLYFFFAGHGITARVANRDEHALVTPGFDDLHTDHSLAIRSLTEHFETTPFKDQFFFVDACRDVPWANREFEIGRWPIPRRRDPGEPPVQQFILYATSPGLTAAEVGWPGEAVGAFTDVLMAGLAGEGRAKAWSWERNRYEVRWERLATYVKDVMEERKHPTEPPRDLPPGGWPIQIPQDAGSRGAGGRERDAVLASFSRGGFRTVELTLELKADPAFEEAEVSVVDAIGEPVVSALRVPGTSVKFTLPQKTYAARATTPDKRVGRLTAPIELYEALTRELELRPDQPPASGQVSEGLGPEEIAAAGREDPPGQIEIRSLDPLGIAEVRDEAGRVVAVMRGGDRRESKPGFYRVRQIGPEQMGEEQFVVLSAGESEAVQLAQPRPAAFVRELAGRLNGGSGDDHVITLPGAEPVAWAQPSTIVAAAVGAALHDDSSLGALGLESPRARLGEQVTGVALYAVGGDGVAAFPKALSTRVWPAGDGVPSGTTPLRPSAAGVAAVVTSAEPGQHWLSLEHDGVATVVALPVLQGRLATIVAQLEPERTRLFQFHPIAGPAPSAAPGRLRRLEHLQRMLLGGRLDGAQTLAEELAATATDDPFAGCLGGYVLLRLGLHKQLEDIASAIISVAPKLSDAYILRGEREAARGKSEAANQAFADAVNVGVPAFGEGLTRLIEGLRLSAFSHPRGALVRYIFQRHERGSMWAAFTPPGKLEAGRLVITGADLGFEG